MTGDLVAWLRTQLDDDERAARSVEVPDDWTSPRWFQDVDAEFIARHDPARVLREVEAKRRIIDLHAPHLQGACPTCWTVTKRSSLRVDYPCPTLRLLALPYADRPGYREEWRP